VPVNPYQQGGWIQRLKEQSLDALLECSGQAVGGSTAVPEAAFVPVDASEAVVPELVAETMEVGGMVDVERLDMRSPMPMLAPAPQSSSALVLHESAVVENKQPQPMLQLSTDDLLKRIKGRFLSHALLQSPHGSSLDAVLFVGVDDGGMCVGFGAQDFDLAHLMQDLNSWAAGVEMFPALPAQSIRVRAVQLSGTVPADWSPAQGIYTKLLCAPPKAFYLDRRTKQLHKAWQQQRADAVRAQLQEEVVRCGGQVFVLQEGQDEDGTERWRLYRSGEPILPATPNIVGAVSCPHPQRSGVTFVSVCFDYAPPAALRDQAVEFTCSLLGADGQVQLTSQGSSSPLLFPEVPAASSYTAIVQARCAGLEGLPSAAAQVTPASAPSPPTVRAFMRPSADSAFDDYWVHVTAAKAFLPAKAFTVLVYGRTDDPQPESIEHVAADLPLRLQAPRGRQCTFAAVTSDSAGDSTPGSVVPATELPLPPPPQLRGPRCLLFNAPEGNHHVLQVSFTAPQRVRGLPLAHYLVSITQGDGAKAGTAERFPTPHPCEQPGSQLHSSSAVRRQRRC